MALEVVSFEQAKGALAFARHTELMQFLDSQAEQTAQPFFFEELLKRFRRRNRRGIHHRASQLLFGGGEIQGHVRDISAALLAPAGFIFIRNKAVHANAQVGSQASLLWSEFFEQLALEHFDKKALRQILRFVRGPVPAQANVFVDGLPVGGAK